MKKKYFILYLAYLVWELHHEAWDHMEISAKSKNKEDFSKHFTIHLCDIKESENLMRVIKTWFPEIYQEKGKSIAKHFEEAKELLNKNYFGKAYKKLI